MQHTHAASTLLRIADLSQDLTVGLGPAVASVRTLTNVSLTVSAHELVVLSGTRGAGERALLAVIAGDRRGVTGVCDVNMSARVRLMRIDSKPALALVQEWARATHVSPSNATTAYSRPPELFLLDVTVPATEAGTSSAKARAPWTEDKRGELLAWAALCRARGGAVVMAAGQALGEGLFDHALAHQPPAETGRSEWRRHRTTAPGGTLAVFERHASASPVRIVVMHSGRLAPAVRLGAHEVAG